MIVKQFEYDKRMQVLHVVASMQVGGIQRGLLESLIDLDWDRFDADVLCVRRRDFWGFALEGHGIRCWAMRQRLRPHRLFKMLRFIVKLRHALARRKISVLHVHHPHLVPPVVLAGKMARVPCIVAHYHSDHGESYWGGLRPAWLRWERRAAAKADRIIAVSETVARGVSRWLRVAPTRIDIIPNGVNVVTRIKGLSSNDGLSEPVVPEGWRVVGGAGRLIEDKCWEDFILAATEILKQHPNTRFWLIGEADVGNTYRQELEALLHRLDLDEHFELLGNRPDIDDLLRRMDVAVLCSRREGRPSAVLEYMNAGTPLVATDIPAVRDLVTHQREGLLTPVNNFHELARSVGTLLTDGALARRLRRAGSRLAARHRWPQTQKQTEQLYRSVLDAKHHWQDPPSASPPPPKVDDESAKPSTGLGRILYLFKTDLEDQHGRVTQSLHTIADFARQGRPLTVVAPIQPSRMKKVMHDVGVADYPNLKPWLTFVRFDEIASRRSPEGYFRSLLKRYYRRGHRLLYFRQPRLGSLVLPMARELGYRVVMENHCPYSVWAIRKRGRCWSRAPASLHWYRMGIRQDVRYERELYQHLDAVICTTPAIEERVKRLAPGTTTLLMPNGAPNVPDKIPAHSDPLRNIDVLYVGKTTVEKGTDEIIQAMTLLPNRTLHIVGGPTEEELAPFRSLARAVGVAERVVFHPWMAQRDAHQMMRRARVGVHPISGRGSNEWRLYTCPLKILEYMASGTPIVSTRLPAVEAILRDGDNGLLVPPADHRALAAAIERILADADLAERLRQSGFQTAQELSSGRRVEKIVRFLEDLTRPAAATG